MINVPENRRVFIYGFKPFASFNINISEKIINLIKPVKNLNKYVFPVEFNKTVFIDTIKSINPDIIIGTGMCKRGSKIRIEKKAVNIMKNLKSETFKKINPDFSTTYCYKTTFKIKTTQYSRYSYNAGTYVCNFSMFVILEYINKLKKNIKFAFLHIPQKLNPLKAKSLLGKLINDSLKGLANE